MLCTPAFGQTTATDWINGAENLTSYSIKSSVTQTLKLNPYPGANSTSEKVTTVTETTETVAVLNLSSLEAHASSSTKNQMEMPGQPAKTNTTSVDFYQIGNSTYMKDESGNWTHLVDPRSAQKVWGPDKNNQVTAIAKTFCLSMTEDLGSEDINGEDAYKLKIVTGIGDYINLYNTSFAIAAKVTQYPMYLPSVNRTELNETGKMEKTIWISKKSYLPVKYHSIMSFSMTPEIKGAIDPNTGQMKMFNQSIRLGAISFAIDTSDLYYDFNKKVAITPPKEALMDWNNQGIALYNQGKYDDAIKAYDEAIRLDPKYAAFWHNTGNALANQGNHDEAIRLDQVAADVDKMIQNLNDTSPSVREAAVETLKELNDTRAVEPLIQALKDEDSSVREGAAWSLGKLNDSLAVVPLILALKDTDYWVRWNAAWSLGELNDTRAVEPLILALKDKDSDGRWRAAESLGKLNDIRAVEPLILALNDEDSDVQLHAAESLGKLNDIRAVEPLILALNDEDSDVQLHAAESLGKLNDIRAVEPLILTLKDEYSSVRWWAAWALGNLGDIRAIEPLKSALKDEDEDEVVREAAADALTIRLDPNYANAWYNKGLVLSGQGKYDEAIKAFDEAVRLDPNYADAWYNRGYALYNLGKYDEAIKCYDEVIRLIPNDAGAWYNKGKALYGQGNYDEAIKAYGETIRLDPKYFNARNNKNIGGAGRANLRKKYLLELH